MKKIIILFVCMLSTLIFFQIYQLSLQKEHIEFIDFPLTLQSKMQKDELMTIEVPILEESDKLEFVDLFSDFLDESNATGVIVGYQQKDNKNAIADYYILTNNKTINRYLKEKAPNLDMNSISEKRYISTIPSKINELKIPLLSTSTFKDSGYQVSIHPFFQIQKDTGYKFTGQYLAFIPTNNQLETFEQLKAFFTKSNPQYKDNISLVEYASDWDKAYDKELNLIQYYIIIISIVILILLFTFIIKQSKQIFVMKLQGTPNYKILNHLYLPILIQYNLCYVTIQLILYCILIGYFNSVTYDFVYLLVKQFLTFTSLSLAIFLLTFLYLKFLFKANNYLLQTNLSQIFKLNFIIKISITILTITPFISIWNENHPFLNDTIIMAQNKHTISNFYTMSNIFEYKADTMKKFMNMGEYVNFDIYDIYKDDPEYDKPGSFPYIYVNNNYLKNYNLINEASEEIRLQDLKNGDLLVPIGTKDFNKDYFCYGMRCNIIYYSNDVTFLNYVPTSTLHTVKNPVIQYFNHYDPAFYYSEGNLYLPKTKSPEYYKDVFKGITSKTELSLKDNQYNYNSYADSRNKALIKVLLVTTITIFIYLSFVYQSVYVFLNDQQKKLAIQYLQGYTKFQRYSILYISNNLALLLAGVISIILLKLPFLDVIRYILVLMIIEDIQITLLLHRFHKRSISQILKGDQL